MAARCFWMRLATCRRRYRRGCCACWRKASSTALAVRRRSEVDVRVIAATHQNLETRVASGAFREDLLHRLNVIRVEIPPLRARREDIPDLLRHYLAQAARELGVESKSLTPAAEQLLLVSDWPGNVRQLVNACRRLTVLAAGREIKASDIPSDLGGSYAGCQRHERLDATSC